jgi:ribosome-associated heat shock protein Hsp15
LADDAVRVDQWLWSVRVFKTRTLATDACRAGHVAVNRAVTKASTSVRVGDLVTVRYGGRDRVFEVVRLVQKRVGAPIAAECLIDRTPPPPDDPMLGGGPAWPRDPATGRPTKRDRREIDRLRGRR